MRDFEYSWVLVRIRERLSSGEAEFVKQNSGERVREADSRVFEMKSESEIVDPGASRKINM